MGAKLYLILSLIFVLTCGSVFAQGCSDAGVCSMGSLGLVQEHVYEKLPHDKVTLELVEEEDTELFSETFDPTKSEKDTNQIVGGDIKYELDSTKSQPKIKKYKSTKLTLNYFTIYGVGDNNTSIITNQLEVNYNLIDKKLYAQVKVPFQTAIGELATTNGLGDITMSLSYNAVSKKKSKLSLVGGAKLPTNNSNLTQNGTPLPMVYQSSLGSIDALFGFNYRYNTWDATVAYQHPFTVNNNGYLHDTIQTTHYNSYFESRQLQRAGDAVLRINKTFKTKKAIFSSGMLFIYHVANDKYVNNQNKRVEAENSKGMTINLNFSATTRLSKKIDLVAIYAHPILLRENRPAGLTRKFVVMAGLKLKLF